MKARIAGVLLCVGAFVLSMFLLLSLIENPMTQVPDIGQDPPRSDPLTPDDGSEDEGGVASDVTSIEGVMTVSKETQTFFAGLATDAAKSISDLSAMQKKWDNAALYLKERAADEKGAAFYTALASATRTYTESLPTDAASFAAKSGAVLTALSQALPQEGEEASGRYPALDLSENGEVAGALLRFWREREKTTGSVTVTYGGEVAMGDYIGSSSYQALYGAENAKNPLTGLVPVFATDDITVVSLNAPLTTYTVPSVPATEAFRGSSADTYAKHLKSAGVDAVILSTCHIRDFGETGYNDTKAALQKAGLSVVEHSTATYVDTTAGKVALLAFDLTGTKNERYTEIPKTKIAEAKNAGAVACVVYFHFDESESVTAAMANTLRDAAANGADLVLSSHSDKLEGALFSTDAKTPLLFSPGFLSNASAPSAPRDAFLFQMNFSIVDGDTADRDRLIFAVDNHAGDTQSPFAPTLVMDKESVQRIRSALSASLPNFQGRITEGALSYISVSE